MRITSTGASSDFQKMHLYDVAGNLWEWTQEVAFNNNTVLYFSIRGGSIWDLCGSCPASIRYGPDASSAVTNIGFRVALYIK